MSGNIEIDQSKIKKNHVNVRVGTKIKIIKNFSQEVEILQLTKRRISPKELTNFILCIVVQFQQRILKLKMTC